MMVPIVSVLQTSSLFMNVDQSLKLQRITYFFSRTKIHKIKKVVCRIILICNFSVRLH